MNRARTSTLKRFSFLVATFRGLKNIQDHIEMAVKPSAVNIDNRRERFIDLLEQIKCFKNKVIEKRLALAKALIEKNPFLFQLSTFELMEYDFHENTHSNVLEYVFTCAPDRRIGSQILSQFIDQIPSPSAKAIASAIRCQTYRVEREKFIKNGRIDLFIIDEINHFVIVIENKLYAPVRTLRARDKNGESLDQLKIYKQYIESEKAYQDYKKLYILLSYLPHGGRISSFIEADYRCLYEAIKSVSSNDSIINQYRLLLHSLVYRMPNKRTIIKNGNTLSLNQDIDLYSLELITEAMYDC